MTAPWLVEDAPYLPEPDIDLLPFWQRAVVLLAAIVACWSPIVAIIVWGLR